jgi:hypothetical protein
VAAITNATQVALAAYTLSALNASSLALNINMMENVELKRGTRDWGKRGKCRIS